MIHRCLQDSANLTDILDVSVTILKIYIHIYDIV